VTNKHRYERPKLDAVVSELIATHPGEDAISSSVIRAAAPPVNYSPRHLQRVLAQHREPDPQPSAKFEVDEPTLVAVFQACGNLSAAHQHLAAQDHPVPPIRTFRRKVTNHFGSAQMAYARRGSVGFR
jgi:hypothetical protein